MASSLVVVLQTLALAPAPSSIPQEKVPVVALYVILDPSPPQAVKEFCKNVLLRRTVVLALATESAEILLVAPVATRTFVVVVPVTVNVLVVSFHVKLLLPAKLPPALYCTAPDMPAAPVPSPPLSAAQMRLPCASVVILPLLPKILQSRFASVRPRSVLVLVVAM